ncbi:MAG: carbohydrate ABC transporter permease [Chloroflexi bacterium]|nr:carbohydrate ABC transporter permease [Chloroflexota bacterium]
MRVSRTTATAIRSAALAAGAFVTLLPFFWMVSASLKPVDRVFALPVEWVPANPRWETYVTALTRYPFDRYFLNSLLIASAITIANVFFCSLAGYGLSKFRYPGRDLAFVAILSTLMLPLEVVMVPTYLVTKEFGWLNSYQGLIVPLALDAFGVFLMRQFILGIPSELIEAARMDGATEWTIYRTIVLPLSRPALAALAIFTFRESWDQFIWPFLVISQDDLRTVPLGIQMFESAFGTAYNEVMAVAVIGMLPMAILFFVLQRAFVQGITMTGIK